MKVVISLVTRKLILTFEFPADFFLHSDAGTIL